MTKTETDLVERQLLHRIARAEEHAGTVPAKEAVKLVPMDWHAVCASGREAAAEVTRLRSELEAVRAEADGWTVWAEGLTPAEISAGHDNHIAAVRARTFKEAAGIADEHARDAGDMAARGYYTSEERAARNTGRGIAAAIRARAEGGVR